MCDVLDLMLEYESVEKVEKGASKDLENELPKENRYMKRHSYKMNKIEKHRLLLCYVKSECKVLGLNESSNVCMLLDRLYVGDKNVSHKYFEYDVSRKNLSRVSNVVIIGGMLCYEKK